MMIFSTMGRYMANRFFITIIGVFFLMLLLIFFIDFVEVLRSGARHEDVSISALALITLLRIPIFAELVLPFSVLIGTIGAFLTLSRTSELVIIRAAGLSVWQFLQPGLVVGVVLGVLAVTVYNPLASAMKAESERIQTELFKQEKSFGRFNQSGGSWLRQEGLDGPTVLHARASANRGLTLGGVTLLQFDLNNRFYEQIQANKAELRQGYWSLEDVVVQSAGNAPAHYRQYTVSTFLTPAQIMDSLGSIESLSFWQLPGFIDFAKKAGIPAARYELQYQLFLVRPLLLAAMIFIAATCSLKAFRFGKIQTMVLTGLSGGFGFFVLSEFSRKVGASGLVPVTLAAWAPPLVALLLSATVLLHQEDG
jgi:lipopolysaccharide export system permease protein